MKLPPFLRDVPLLVVTVFALLLIGFSLTRTRNAEALMQSTAMPPLNRQEAAVILNKATEPPFSGKYTHQGEPGTYICRQCGMPLYSSEDKFDSGCGWPSFDAELPGAVRRLPDADGQRTEIVCAHCNGHLGHVFEGEGFTEKNTRHCVNSVSMAFAEKGSEAEKEAFARRQAAGITATAIVAGGCFWGVEDAFEKLPGVVEAVSGYTGGSVPSPSYEQVSTGRTGHAEAVLIRYDPSRISYEQILRRFFEIHDPTQLNRQGPDVGTQYRSAVFYASGSEKYIAEHLIDELKKLGYKVVTTLEKAGPFYEAEAYHQNFTARTGRGGCHLPVKRFEQRAD